MSDRQCPFYVYESTGWFSYKETCRRTGRDISSSTYNAYCNNYESGYSKCPNFKPEEESKGCFISSACIEAKGLCDCCKELTILRDFRDNWLLNQPEGKKDIDEYYSIAPTIVEKIYASKNRMALLNELYDRLVIPCVELIEAGDNEAAWELYRKITNGLREKFLM